MTANIPHHTHLEGWRLTTFYVGIAVVFSFLTFRLFSLQILNPQAYVDQANENMTGSENIPSPRGVIYDRNGVVLARNIPSYNVVITPEELPGADVLGNIPLDPAELPGPSGAIQDIYRQLSQLTGVPVSRGEITEQTAKNFTPCQTDLGIAQIVYIGDSLWPYEPIRIKCNVDEKVALTIQEKAQDWPGVGIEVQAVRDYPTGSLTSAVVGFMGPMPGGQENDPCYKNEKLQVNRDKVGYAGIEQELQCDLTGINGLTGLADPAKANGLAGINGTRQYVHDVAGKEVGPLGTPVQPVSGNSVRLTIDTRLQQVSETALINWMQYWNVQSELTGQPMQLTNGVVIAINPKTGEILSLVSYPSYENNRMARAIPTYYYDQLIQDPEKPLFNQAVSAEQAPGSVFKIAASLGILNEGVVTPDYQIDDPGKIELTEKFYASDPGRSRPYY